MVENMKKPGRLTALPKLDVTMALPPASPDSPTLRTSKLINMGVLSPTRRRMVNDLTMGPLSPTSPARRTPPSPGGTSDVLRLPHVTVPPQLRFDSWWFEAGQRASVGITYDTATKLCTCSMGQDRPEAGGCGPPPAWPTSHVRELEVTMEPWDLHVGATLRLAGRRVTLRRAADVATAAWLDAQAGMLMKDCERLRRQVGKYRQVAPQGTQLGAHTLRCEAIDVATHQVTPCGGHANLAGLRSTAAALIGALRHHQVALPRVNGAVAGDLLAAATGPADWSAPSTAADSPRSLPAASEATSARASPFGSPRAPPAPAKQAVSLTSIQAVPLAASAARLTAAEVMAAEGRTPLGPELSQMKTKRSSATLVFHDEPSRVSAVSHRTSRGTAEDSAAGSEGMSASGTSEDSQAGSEGTRAGGTASSRSPSRLEDPGERNDDDDATPVRASAGENVDERGGAAPVHGDTPSSDDAPDAEVRDPEKDLEGTSIADAASAGAALEES